MKDNLFPLLIHEGDTGEIVIKGHLFLILMLQFSKIVEVVLDIDPLGLGVVSWSHPICSIHDGKCDGEYVTR